MVIAGAFSPTCCETPCRESSLWTVFSRQESKGETEALAPSKKVSRRTRDEETTPTSETRSVSPRRSVIQQHDQAGVDRNQIYCHPDNEFHDGRATGSSFRGSSTVSSRSLCRSDASRKLPDQNPIAVLEQLRDRIKPISLNMNAMNKSCSAEAATGFALPSPDRPAVRLRARAHRHHHGGPVSAEKRRHRRAKTRTRRHQWRRQRSEKRACSDTIEESSSVDEVDARRMRPRFCGKSH